MIVMKTNSLITYWSELFIHLLAPKRAVGLSVDQGSQCILTPKTVQSTSLSFQSVYYVHGCNGLTLGVLGVGHGIADNVLKENFQNTACLLVDQSRNSLYTPTASETTDRWLGNSLDIIA